MFQSSMNSIWKWMVDKFHPFESCEWPFLRNHRVIMFMIFYSKFPDCPVSNISNGCVCWFFLWQFLWYVIMECYGLLVTPRCEPEPSEVHLPNPELAGYYVGNFHTNGLISGKWEGWWNIMKYYSLARYMIVDVVDGLYQKHHIFDSENLEKHRSGRRV